MGPVALTIRTRKDVLGHMTEPLRILVAEDSESDAELVQRELKRGGLDFQIHRVETETDFRRELDEFRPDLVISDFSMPQFNGRSALAIARESRADIPFIFISGTIGENVAVDMMKAGADDYVMKNNLARLVPALKRELREAEVRRGRRLAEGRLKESEAALHRAQVMAKIAHVVTGPDGSFERWSETLPRLIGVDAAQMPRSTREWLDLLHPDDRAGFRATAIEAARTGSRRDIEYRLRPADGAWIHVRQVIEPLQSQADAEGGTRWFSTLQDVTEHRLAEEALHASQERARLIIESALDAFVAMDAEGGIIDWNRQSERTFGWSREDALGRNLAETIIPEPYREAHQRGLARFLETGQGPVLNKRIEITALHRDGREFPVELVITPIRLMDGNAFGGFVRDITDRKAQEEKILRLTRVYAVLSGINALIVRVRDRDELFREACRIAADAGKFKLAWVGVVDREAARLKPVAWHGVEQDYIRLMPLGLNESIPEQYGLAGRAVTERRPMVAADMAEDPRVALHKEARKRGFHSLVMLPLLVSDEAVGVLALYATEVGFFDEEEMKLLIELSGDISFALDHIAKAEKLDYLAYYDSLTGLANRSLFHERLVQYLSAAQSEKSRLAVAVVDVDRFKTINDSLGRQAGDELLRLVAERIESHAGPIRMARISADRFAIVRTGVSSEGEVARLIEQWLAECFGPPYTVGGTELRVSAKAGIALFPNDGADADALFQNAEAALKKAKATGERYLFHTQQMTERIGEKLALENKLRQALEKEEFVLHYQPKVDTATRRIESVEALIRWQSPELGLVPPMQFIPLLEETGLILEVGAWALRRAVLDHRKWKERGLAAPRISVNVSAVQLRRRDFVATVEEAIRLGPVPPGIDIEITESLVMEDIEANMKKLEAVRVLGLSIAIDDFGTGYSSLGYLAKLPVHSLKIDRSFIITMLKDPAIMTLVSTIVSMAHSLRLKVVAEGVDTEEQAEVLDRLGCDQLQGYLFSRPVSFENMTALLGSRT
jgi:PAS domain S-box-containing protein/diguanylate cyclase (GGDEF)-like protein